MTFLLAFIIGFELGRCHRQLYDKLSIIYDDFVTRREAAQAGVVKANPVRATRAQPIDLSVGAGGVMRPNPDQHRLAAIKEREAKARAL
jgi:hypothetical protein